MMTTKTQGQLKNYRFNFLTRERSIEGLAALLILLFFYAAVSKLANYEQSRNEMFKQIFPRGIAIVLAWLVPVTELIVVLLLLHKETRLKGLYASLILMIFFTLYIAIAMSGIFGHRPCSCGGILKNMGYREHLVFNLFFIVLAVIGIALEKGWASIHIWFHSVNRKEGNRP
ncbi:MAG TPA: MauE/DoxX family redox-associated membrane protein [Pedobacter sp.]|uniref:MauE/DoxX family redox-associated membrane protein n=1 Tax=Pedobacter sp. TaxID=1411316 RepID=UPI002D173FAD|nr:MauE/DoxX family redox-associated membrane protein [Pedobacter sp.]HMI05446.1 MauE/DoxX family redox-associated membrane protein [Pedobacter sp.]